MGHIWGARFCPILSTPNWPKACQRHLCGHVPRRLPGDCGRTWLALRRSPNGPETAPKVITKRSPKQKHVPCSVAGGMTMNLFFVS